MDKEKAYKKERDEKSKVTGVTEYGILWMNKECSPFRSQSEEARESLREGGFPLVEIETVGIGGPIYEFRGKEYRGIEQIKELIRV